MLSRTIWAGEVHNPEDLESSMLEIGVILSTAIGEAEFTVRASKND